MKKNKLSSTQKTSIKVRTITGLVLAAIAIPCIIFGNWFFLALTLFIAISCAYETVHITDLRGKIKIFTYAIVIILLLATCYYIIVRNALNTVHAGGQITFETICTTQFRELGISEMLLMLTAAVLFVTSFIFESFNIKYVFYLLSMIVILSLGIQSLLYLRFSTFSSFKSAGIDTTTSFFKYGRSCFLLVFVVIGVIFNDIGAYFTGILFGQHKMAPRISPNKTWEGAIGGVIFSFVFSFSFAIGMAAGNLPLIPQFDLNHWYWLLIVCLLIPLFSDIGDFLFSSIKRHFNVKDYSAILPGHGGILDRFDSMLFASGLVSALIVFMDFVAGKI